MSSHPPHTVAPVSHSDPSAMSHQARRFEDLWDHHGGSVYALACALLGDETAAARAMGLALRDLAGSASRTATIDDHRSWARHVYLRSQEIHAATSPQAQPPSPRTPLGRLTLPQRTCVALCLFGAHTSREVASLLGMSPTTVADLLTSGLKDVKRLASSGDAAVA